MSYRPVLEGLGKVYPFTIPAWGPLPATTLDVDIPIDRMVDDALDHASPRATEAAHDASNMISARVEESVAKPLYKALDQGTVLVERVRWDVIAGSLVIGIGIGWLGSEVLRHRKARRGG